MRRIAKVVFPAVLFVSVMFCRVLPAQEAEKSASGTASGPYAQTEIARLIGALAGSWSLKLTSPAGKDAGSGTEV
jgi:hypothetical protein